MKDPLEYTREELSNLSTGELQSLLKESDNKVVFYSTQQMAKKILINSLYGALGNKHFALFNEKIAQAITMSGRYFIRLLGKNIEEKFQAIESSEKSYLVYGDTDSVYFQIEPIMAKIINLKEVTSLEDKINIMDKFSEEVMQPQVQKTIDQFCSIFNAYDKSAIGAKREILADSCCFVAKKKYFARVRDSEGVRYPLNAPHMKVMGLELARANTPNYCKEKLEESLSIILDKNEKELKEWIKSVKDEFMHVHAKDMCMFGSVSSVSYNLDDQGIPWMCKAAVYYNRYVKEHKLTSRFTEIKGGDKVKIIFLRKPNKFGHNVIAYLDDAFEEEFKSDIDYDAQFTKGFMNPLNNMVKVLNYDIFHEDVEVEDW